MCNKKRIAVLGAGTMGLGISQIFATAGHEVKLVLVYDDKQRCRPIEAITANLNFLEQNGILSTVEIPKIISRISFTEQLEEAAGFADVIFECIVEDLAIKQSYFQTLDKLCPPTTILATNTSAISITEIAAKALHQERIIGTHFWNPAYLIPLVEVIKTEAVSDEVTDQVYRLLESIGKKPVIVKKDVPGFLANRMQHALFREAISIVENGIADPEDVDNAIKFGFGMRLGVSGPMEVIDRGGIDLTYAIHKYLFPYIENSTEPSKLLTELLDKKDLGFKTGKGFQEWPPERIAHSQEDLNRGLIAVLQALNRL